MTTINVTYYGTISEANDYFGNRLHERAWTRATVVNRPKALIAATRIIDTLNFKGDKAVVYAVKAANANATESLVNALSRAAELTQPLEFPRGADTDVPEAIRLACYEIGHSLLDGKDPELELEKLGIVSQGLSSVRTTYSRTHVPIEHLVNGVPNAMAWRLLRPFLRDDDAIRLSRVS